MMSRFAIAVAITCLVAPGANADDKAAAEALFVRAKQLDRAGDAAAACPLFEASYHADPQLGVLLNVANCHEVIGRTGTAWAEFREGVELAARKHDPREAFALRRASALEPRLVRLRVDASATAGLVVQRDATDITALVAHDVVIDPGAYVIAASAPGHRSWTTTIDVQREGETVTVVVPVLAEDIVAPVRTVLTTSAPSRPTSPPPRAERSALRTWGLVVGSVGIGVAATGLGLGAYAWSEWKGTRDPALCDASNVCSAEGHAQIASARSHARTSTYLVAAGGATVAVSLVMLWIAPRGAEQPRVTPTVDANGASVSLSGSF